MPIFITRTTTGLLIQKDELDIQIDGPAVSVALGPTLLTLIDTSKVIGQARRENYEAGLAQGYAQGQIEAETRHRIEARDAAEVQILLGSMACAA